MTASVMRSVIFKMEIYKTVVFLNIFIILQVPKTKCESGIVIFNFPKMVFMEFFDAIGARSQNLAYHSGVIEVLSYKILTFPNGPRLRQEIQEDQCFSVISFRRIQEARRWVNEDKVVTQRNNWSHGLDVNIIVTESVTPRHMPFTESYDAHLLVVFRSFNDTILRREVQPHFRDLYKHYGGVESIVATKWERVSGSTWPPVGSNWLFYGPMPTMQNISDLMRSQNLVTFVSQYRNVITDPRMYAAETFFNVGNSFSDMSFVLKLYIVIFINYFIN